MPLEASTSTVFFNLLDCRSWKDYLSGHIQGAANFPVEELSQRLHELPSNDYPLCVSGDAFSVQQASELLQQKNYRIAQSIVLTDAVIVELQLANRWQQGMENPRLWQASPLLERFPTWAKERGLSAGSALDLAAGAGRDAVWLAMHGWQVTAVDCMAQALQKTADLALRRDCQVQCIVADLETREGETLLPSEQDLIIMVRYLHRPLFAQIERLLRPGGYFICQTFLQGAAQFGSPKNPNRLLKDGELAAIFKNFTIALDEVEYLPDGRPVSAFIAQKPF